MGIRGAESLRDELARVRENLRDTDATIEKLTGRPAAFASRPFQRFPGQSRYGADEGRGRGRASQFPDAGFDNYGPPPAKRTMGTFGRLGLPVGGGPRAGPSRRNRDDDDEEDLPHKPVIASSVVATPKDSKTREEAIAEQQSGVGGEVGKTRNRRMFGLLLGTLVRFRQDEQTKEEQKVKRKAVERRLEEKQYEERERLVRERQQLFLDRRRQQGKMRALEQKIELVEMHESWEAETRNLECFIRTNARPHVFFLPKSHIPSSLAKLEETKRILQGLVAERRKQLEEEIDEIMAKGDRGKAEEDEDDEEGASDNQLDESIAGQSQKTDGRVSKTVDEGSTLSDIEDHDQAAIEFGLRADVGSADAVETPLERSVSGNEQQQTGSTTTTTAEERDKQAIGKSGGATAMDCGVDAEKKTTSCDVPEKNDKTRDRDDDRRGARERRHHGDSRRRDETEDDNRSHRRERRGHRNDREEEDRSKRREHRHERDDSRRHRDRHGDDDRDRDRHRAKHRDSSRHGKEDDSGDNRRGRDHDKDDESNRKPHETQDNNGDKERVEPDGKTANETEEGEVPEAMDE